MQTGTVYNWNNINTTSDHDVCVEFDKQIIMNLKKQKTQV